MNSSAIAKLPAPLPSRQAPPHRRARREEQGRCGVRNCRRELRKQRLLRAPTSAFLCSFASKQARGRRWKPHRLAGTILLDILLSASLLLPELLLHGLQDILIGPLQNLGSCVHFHEDWSEVVIQGAGLEAFCQNEEQLISRAPDGNTQLISGKCEGSAKHVHGEFTSPGTLACSYGHNEHCQILR